jgi:phosphatidylinositol glycan class U
VKEGVFLYNNGVDPYIGDIFHENPFVLKIASFLLNNFLDFISLFFIIVDLLTAIFIFYGTRGISKKNVSYKT